MNFEVLSRYGYANTSNRVYLTLDNWNDYDYYTLYGIFYLDSEYKKSDLGSILIGGIGQNTGLNNRVLILGQQFETLEDTYFSMGASDYYYEALNLLPDPLRDEILEGLNDIAKNPDLFKSIENEAVFQNSFLRSVSISTISGHFSRLARGDAKLTSYSFSFLVYSEDTRKFSYSLDFKVVPDSLPSSNVHVIIARNGVGKTNLLRNMASSLCGGEFKGIASASFDFVPEDWSSTESEKFANLITVSFSAFDEINSFPLDLPDGYVLKPSVIGLLINDEGNASGSAIKNLHQLTDEFYSSLSICRSRGLRRRWFNAVSTLESDPNFRNANLKSLYDYESVDEQKYIRQVFWNLSSGHKIVLLTITRIVEKLQEKTLILMDEPEAYLHPPLLSAFIRALSDLLIATNGVAIIATHSPVILQEVPSNCVWKLNRPGDQIIPERPSLETFGENVGTLTSEVFKLEVLDSGFYNVLDRICYEKNFDYNEILDAFNGQLGTEARSLVMSLIANREE